MKKIIIGVDPGTHSLGLSVFYESSKPKYHTTYIATKKFDKNKRIDEICNLVREDKNLMKVLQLEKGDELTIGCEDTKMQRISSSALAKVSGAIGATIIGLNLDTVARTIDVHNQSWYSRTVALLHRAVNRVEKKAATIAFVEEMFHVEPKTEDEADAICIGSYLYDTEHWNEQRKLKNPDVNENRKRLIEWRNKNIV